MLDGTDLGVWAFKTGAAVLWLGANLFRGWLIIMAIFGLIAFGKALGVKNQ